VSVPELQRAAEKLFKSANGNPMRLAMTAAQFQAAAAARPSGALEIVGGVSGITGKPYVQFSWGENRGQTDVDTARDHARLVLESCANAVAEAALLEWARDELDVDVERAVVMIDALRRYRHDRWGQPDLELEFDKPAPDDEAEA